MFRNSLTIILIFIGLLGYACRQEDRETKIDIPLNSAWKFRKAETNAWYPAHVPGSLSADIAEIGIKVGDSPFDIEKIRKADWEYLTIFDVDHSVLAHDVVQLCFKGIVSHADVYLNDSLLVKTNGRFSPTPVNCKHRLKAKDNRLRIIFHHGNGRKAWLQNHFSKTDSFTEHPCFDKKKEISPFIGIRYPIYLEAWSMAKIDDVSLMPDSVSAKKAIYSANLSLTSVVNEDATLELLINNKPAGKPIPISLKKGNNVLRTKVFIEKPKLWWPNGLGNPNLYIVTVRLKKGQSLIQEKIQRLGVRTIELVNRLNSPDHSCFIKVNGSPVFLKGAGLHLNSFLPYDTASAFFNKILDDAKESNFNVLRVSNMEIYNDSFYDLCDNHGILLWQDLQANSIWDRHTAVDLENMQSEMIEAIRRARKHPCLALFRIKEPAIHRCENETYPCTSGKSLAKGSENAYMESLESLVKEHSGAIPYLSETEANGAIPGVDLFNGKLTGSIVMHYGIPWAETGKADNGVLKENTSVKDFVQRNFKVSKDWESDVYVARLAQSEMMKSIIENHRTHMPRCMGSIYEQMNAGGNRVFFSTLDSAGRWTPAQYAIKDAFSHILVAPVREKNEVTIYAVSDAYKNLDAILLVRLIDFQGKDIFVRQIPVVIETNTSSILMTLKEKDLLNNIDRAQCCLVVQLNQTTKTLSQNILYFTEFKNLKLPKPLIDMDINDVVKGYNIILKSPVLVKSIFIQTLAKDCLFSDNNFDLLPGKRTKIHVSYNGTKEELLKDIRIRSFADIK